MGYSKQPASASASALALTSLYKSLHSTPISTSKHSMKSGQQLPPDEEEETMIIEEWREAPIRMISQSSVHSFEQTSFMRISQRLTPGSGRKVVHGEENDDVRLQIQQKCVYDGIEQCMHILIPDPDSMQYMSTMKTSGLEKNVVGKREETEAMEMDDFVSDRFLTTIYMGEGKDQYNYMCITNVIC